MKRFRTIFNAVLLIFVYASSAFLGDSFVEAPQFDPSICEVAGSLHDSKEPTIARLLQEKTHYSFSEWPKVCVFCLIISLVFPKAFHSFKMFFFCVC